MNLCLTLSLDFKLGGKTGVGGGGGVGRERESRPDYVYCTGLGSTGLPHIPNRFLSCQSVVFSSWERFIADSEEKVWFNNGIGR